MHGWVTRHNTSERQVGLKALGIGIGAQSSRSQPIGARMSGNVLKDDHKVRSLIENMNTSNQKLVFEL